MRLSRRFRRGAVLAVIKIVGEGRMKKIFLVSMLLALTAWSEPNPKVYPNIETQQLFAGLKWGMNYSTVRNILMEKYKLSDPKEIGLNAYVKSKKAYEFTGGKYNNFETLGLVAIFENDNLSSVTILIAKKDPQENRDIFNKLSAINNKELDIDVDKMPSENKWCLKREGKIVSRVLLAMMPENRGIDVLFSKP